MPTSWTARMLGCARRATASASCSNRRSRSGSSPNPRGEHLDGDVPLQPRVVGAIDRAHAAGPEQIGHVEMVRDEYPAVMVMWRGSLPRPAILRQFSTDPQDCAAPAAYRVSTRRFTDMSTTVHTSSARHGRSSLVRRWRPVSQRQPRCARRGRPRGGRSDHGMERHRAASSSSSRRWRRFSRPGHGHRPRRHARCGQRDHRRIRAATPAERVKPPTGASPEAAAIAAAFTTLKGLFSTSEFLALLTARYAASLARARRLRRPIRGSRSGSPWRQASWRCEQHDGAAVAAYPVSAAERRGAGRVDARSAPPRPPNRCCPAGERSRPGCCAADRSSARSRLRRSTAGDMPATTRR